MKGKIVHVVVRKGTGKDGNPYVCYNGLVATQYGGEKFCVFGNNSVVPQIGNECEIHDKYQDGAFHSMYIGSGKEFVKV